MFKKTMLLLVTFFVASLIGCTNESHSKPDDLASDNLANIAEKDGDSQIEPNEPVSRHDEIKKIIHSIIDERKYHSTSLKRITINENLGSTSESESYIALIYFDFTAKNRRETGNPVMRMYSDDIAGE